MENLKIKGERSEFFTPYVSLDARNGQCEISGESYLEYTGEFYDKIIQWFKRYTLEVNRPLRITFRLTYFNTSSFKAILNVLKFLKTYERKGGKVEIDWFYPEDDMDIFKEAEDLAEGSELDRMQLIPYALDD